ncbi:hypothetical protein NCG97_25830 [Streptomyces lydicamycinicus]|uniref:hypothetical protein n=1 Tax=Streptomyces lydicamycinicus TaxID=1546107 RepID=UPI0020352208|nr:hypothetical protein [Streptomyces lydicamycinicus]USA03284.1 hypothetical protein NCG97_25830 [Streptomyces lydicamycinicus]
MPRGAVQAVAGAASGAAAGAVAEAFAEGFAGVLEGVGGGLLALLGGAAEVVALLRAEVLVDGLGDEVGGHGLQRGDHRLLGRLHDRVKELLGDLLEDPADHLTGGQCGGRAANFGQAEGEGGRGLGRDDFRGQNRQLDDHGDLHADDQRGGGLEGERDDLGRLRGIVEVPRVAGELLPRLAEALDGIAGVLREHIARVGGTPGLMPLHLRREIAPDLRAFQQLVFVRVRPVEAEHVQDPLKRIRQHDRQGGGSP